MGSIPFLTSEHEMVRKSVREFAEKRVSPLAKKIDHENWYPRDLIKELGEMGFLASNISPEYEGPGSDTITTTIILEEVARRSASVGLILDVYTSLTSEPLLRHGSEELKKRYLPKIATGEIVPAFALTEPNYGSDAGNLAATAVREGDEYVINGTKTFITQGIYADLFLVLARTGRKQDKAKGITAFLAEKSPQISVGKVEVMGHRGTGTAEVRFDECRIPASNMVGKLNEGIKVITAALNHGRIIISGLSVGVAQAALELALAYAKERVAFDKPIVEHQAVQVMLADMLTNIEAARLLAYKAAWLFDREDPNFPTYCSISKLYAGKMVVDVCRDAVQIFGGYGYTKEMEVERLFRDSKLAEIGEGTNEMQRILIARRLGKEGIPRSY